MMGRVNNWLSRFSDRSVNAFLIGFAIIAISTALTAAAMFISTRSKLPPFEYVYGLGERASMMGPNIVKLGARAACAGDEVTVPGYTIQINRVPIRVSLVSTWWDVKARRTAQVGGFSDIRYTNYVKAGQIVVDEITVTVPDDLKPGQYQRITTASTPVTYPEAYVVPVEVRDCSSDANL